MVTLPIAQTSTIRATINRFIFNGRNSTIFGSVSKVSEDAERKATEEMEAKWMCSYSTGCRKTDLDRGRILLQRWYTVIVGEYGSCQYQFIYPWSNRQTDRAVQGFEWYVHGSETINICRNESMICALWYYQMPPIYFLSVHHWFEYGVVGWSTSCRQ